MTTGRTSPGIGGITDAASPYEGGAPVASLIGPGAPLTLVDDHTFALSSPSGDMAAALPQGLFVLDVRVLSQWLLLVNGHQLEPLGVQSTESYAAVIAARTRAAAGHADAALIVFRHRHVGWGMRERIVITNHGLESVEVDVELHCDADFASLFEVKERRVPSGTRGRVDLQILDHGLRYRAGEEASGRGTTISVRDSSSVEAGTVRWHTRLAPAERWETCVEVSLTVDGRAVAPRFHCDGDDRDALPARRLEHWRATVPEVRSDDQDFTTALQRAGEDLGALRIFDPEQPGHPVIAAGAPWFMTTFGRDSLLTGWMSLLADPTLAHGVLQFLARLQGAEVDPATEEEPGKILHEVRHAPGLGSARANRLVYYGSADATALFVMLLGELRRWDMRDDLVTKLLPHADRALGWIERFGDRDGDGYVEYERRTTHGLVNQGWKDSWDAIRHPDGTLAKPPIALCEVQGYTYAAYIARAHFAREAGDHAVFERYLERAQNLRRRFNEDFWLDELGTFALALDGDKRPVAAIASNVGHCLWTGIIEPEKAAVVADVLLSEPLFSGWGIRTLATTMAAYNPVSYHNGSVWPHDNAIAAAGLGRYGFLGHAERVIRAQLDVAAVHQGRLPELFAGFDRRELAVPAAYPASCSPQAWAAASPLLWLRTVLGLEPWMTEKKLWVAPHLPDGMDRLDVDRIKIAGENVRIRVAGDEVEVVTGIECDIVTEHRAPQTSLDARKRTTREGPSA